MTTADRKLLDEAIKRHSNEDSWWENGDLDKCIIDDLLEILAKDDLDLKVTRKK